MVFRMDTLAASMGAALLLPIHQALENFTTKRECYREEIGERHYKVT